MSLISVFSLLLVCLSLRACVCSTHSFVPYSQQCPGASTSPSDPYPHLSYDGTRPSLGKVLDGLNLQTTLLVKARETPGADSYVPSTSNLNRVQALSKLFEVVRQRDFIKAMPEGERRGYDPIIKLLDTMASEMCTLLQTELHGSFKTFDCSRPADILDALARLRLFDLTLRREAEVRQRASSIVHDNGDQCDYWNTRVLGNCTVGQHPTAGEVTVQSSYLQPYFSLASTCTCSDGSPLCQISS